MPRHYCVDPQDPYAQQEVLVEFAGGPSDIRLVSAKDASRDDILGDLEYVQRQDLIREIAADFEGFHPRH